jgi:cell division septation protein DedD
MSTVVDPDTGEHAVATTEQPAGTASEPLTCPSCGAPADPGQLMCLECGSRLALGYQRTPRWRLPAAIVGLVLLLAGLGVGIAIAASNDNYTPTATAPAAAAAPAAPQSAPADSTPTASTPTPAPTATTPTASTPTTTPPPASSGTTSTPTPAPPAPATTPSSGWPPGKSAFTVILASLPSKTDADAKLKAAQAAGITTASILHSDDFPTLRPGYWVVFDGQYGSMDQAKAQAATDAGKPGFTDAYPRFVSKDANAKP